jgi:hypothetical protein
MAAMDRSRIALATTLWGASILVGSGCSSPDEVGQPGPSVVESAAKTSCDVDRRGEATGESSAAIVGGDKTPSAESVPLSASQRDAVGAMLLQQGGEWHTFCSATLISQTVVLTAAHCMVDFAAWDGVSSPAPLHSDPQKIAFGVGDDMAQPKARLAAREIHVSPNLILLVADRRVFPSSFGMQPDLAVVVLAEPAELTVPGIEPIPVRELPLEESLGQRVLLGGFGRTTWGSGPTGVRYWTDLLLVEGNPLAINTTYVPGAGTVAPGDSGSGSLVAAPDGSVQIVAATTGPLMPDGGNFGGNVRAAREWLYQFVTTECSSLDEIGACDGDRAKWCSDGRVTTEDCSSQQRTCGMDSCGLMRCVLPPASVDPRCTDLDYGGRCAPGDVLEWCVEGEYRRRECGRYGQLCADSADPAVGRTCLVEPVDGPPQDEPQDVIDSCSGLDGCIEPCEDDMWCALGCFSRAERDAIDRYGDFGSCTHCAIYPTYCGSADSPGLACETDCASNAASVACTQCIDAACGTQAESCAVE